MYVGMYACMYFTGYLSSFPKINELLSDFARPAINLWYYIHDTKHHECSNGLQGAHNRCGVLTTQTTTKSKDLGGQDLGLRHGVTNMETTPRF